MSYPKYNLQIYVPGEDGEGREPLVILDGFEISLGIHDEQARLEYSPSGRTAHIRVYDPEGRLDVDSDVRAWRFGFLVTDVSIIDSSFYLTGYSMHPDRLLSVDAYECENGHLPWEHDGNCYADSVGYEGWLEFRMSAVAGKDDLNYELAAPLPEAKGWIRADA